MLLLERHMKKQVDDQQAIIQKKINDLQDEETADAAIEENTQDPLD